MCPNRKNEEKTCNEVNSNGLYYHEALSHLHSCKSNSFKCPLKCHGKFPDDPTTIQSADAAGIRNHLEGECPCYLETCPKCSAKYSKAEAENHNCVKYLKEKSVNEVLELLKYNEEVGVDYYKLKLKCRNRHDLKRHRGHVLSYGGTPRCDVCSESSLQMHAFFYRCEQCQYDLCRGCALV